jgi:hypothetical protein
MSKHFVQSDRLDLSFHKSVIVFRIILISFIHSNHWHRTEYHRLNSVNLLQEIQNLSFQE